MQDKDPLRHGSNVVKQKISDTANKQREVEIYATKEHIDFRPLIFLIFFKKSNRIHHKNK